MRKADNLPPFCAVVTKSGNLNFLEPSGSVQGCNGTALPFKGTAVAQWLRCCAKNRKVAISIPAGVIGIFIDRKSFRSHYGPGLDSASKSNLYQEHFPGGKGGRCVRLTTLLQFCAVVTKSGNLNFLETSGSLQACNGTDLFLPLRAYLLHLLTSLTYLPTYFSYVLHLLTYLLTSLTYIHTSLTSHTYQLTSLTYIHTYFTYLLTSHNYLPTYLLTYLLISLNSLTYFTYLLT